MERPRRDIADRPHQEEAPLAPPSHAPRAEATCLPDDYAVLSDLPPLLPVTGEEIALLKAFLGTEIDAILYSNGAEQ